MPKISALLDLIAQQAIWVDAAAEDVSDVLLDPDDNHVVACAVVGQADYLVTYDRHFAPLGDEYQGVQIVPPLPFLWAVRGEKKIESSDGADKKRPDFTVEIGPHQAQYGTNHKLYEMSCLRLAVQKRDKNRPAAPIRLALLAESI